MAQGYRMTRVEANKPQQTFSASGHPDSSSPDTKQAGSWVVNRGRDLYRGVAAAAGGVGKAAANAYHRVDDTFGQPGAPIEVPTLDEKSYSPGLAAASMALSIFSHARNRANQSYLNEQIQTERQQQGLEMEKTKLAISEATPSKTVNGLPATRLEAVANENNKVGWPGGFGLDAGRYDRQVLGPYAVMAGRRLAASQMRSTVSANNALMDQIGQEGKARYNELEPIGVQHTNVMMHNMNLKSHPDERAAAYKGLGLIGERDLAGKVVTSPDDWEKQWSTVDMKSRKAMRDAAIDKAVSGYRSSYNARRAAEIEKVMSKARRVVMQKTSENMGGIPFNPDMFSNGWDSSVDPDYAAAGDGSDWLDNPATSPDPESASGANIPTAARSTARSRGENPATVEFKKQLIRHLQSHSNE